MRAAFMTGQNLVEVREAEEPGRDPARAIRPVAASGVSGTDPPPLLNRAPPAPGQGVGDERPHHLGALLAAMVLDHPPLGVDDPLDQVRGHVDAPVGPGPEGRGELQGGHVPRAE